MHSRFTLIDGVLLEMVGDDVVALLPDTTAVRLSGPAAQAAQRVAAGGDMADIDQSAVAELVYAGVVRPEAGVTRRQVVTLGAVATGAGVATLALPSVAAANSVVALPGIWRWIDNHIFFPAGGFADPTWTRWFEVFLGDNFTLPGGSPSSLSVLGGEVPLAKETDDNGVVVPPGTNGILDYIVRAVEGGPAIEKSAPLTGDITGTFTWDRVTYQVTFEQAPDAVPELR